MSEHVDNLRREAEQVTAPRPRQQLLDAALWLEQLEREHFPPDSALCRDLAERLAWLDRHDGFDEATNRKACTLGRLAKELSSRVEKLAKKAAAFPPLENSPPIPMRLTCPECGGLHVDRGEFATRRHHTHACQHCGMVWRPAVCDTVGVQFLPGFQDMPVIHAQEEAP